MKPHLTLRRLLLALCLFFLAVPASAQGLPQFGEAPLDDLIGAMTTEEKALLLVGLGLQIDLPGLPPLDPRDAALPDPTPGAAGRTHPVERLGVPLLVLSDGPAGVRIDPIREDDDRTFYATAFPVATLLASSWDARLVEEVGAAFGREARDFGVDVLLAPGMNIHRSPLGGRNFEYYSEDPVLSGRIAAAFVRGVEGEGVGTSVKHFAANNQEWNRMQLDTRLSERALREIYLRGFEIAIREGEPMTVMSAYNRINGTYASESRDLLMTILRDEWGFDGVVMTDWFAGSDPVAQVTAGTDLIMPGNRAQAAAIAEAIESGRLSMADLDASVRRVLRLALQTPVGRGVEPSGTPDIAAGRAVSRQAATEGMVLLKNEGGALPLAEGARLALFGNGGYRLIKGGTGSGDVNVSDVIELDDALRTAGYSFDADLARTYENYIAQILEEQGPPTPFFPAPPIPEKPLDIDEITSVLDGADAAVVVLTRSSGEIADRVVADDFDLTNEEQAMLRDVSSAARAEGLPVVVVLNVGGVIESASWRPYADAILLAWQPGQDAGAAITDVLSGAVTPSGKLPMTWPMTYTDVPAAESWPGELILQEGEGPGGVVGMMAKPSQTTYTDGLFVGYRYYDAFGVEPAYPFGYGLSYTTFSLSDVALDTSGVHPTVSVTVTNTGDAPGREVVQVYVALPNGQLVHPARELRTFAKTRLLQPGDAETVRLALAPRDFTYYDTEQAAWVTPSGSYTITVGTSSRDLQKAGQVTVSEDRLVEKATPVLRPQVKITERTPADR